MTKALRNGFHVLLLLTLGTVAAPADELLASAPVVSVVIYRPGPAWVDGKPMAQQLPRAHGSYVLDLYEQGYLDRAGGFLDDTGGMMVLKVRDPAQARALAEADPAVKAGVFAYEVRAWRNMPWDKLLERRRARQQK